MDSNKRLILTIVISFAIIAGFQFLYARLYPEPAAPPVAEAPAPAAPAPGAAPAPPPAEGAPGAPAAEPGIPGAPPPPERRAEFRLPESELVVSSHGPGLVTARLLGDKNTRPKSDEQVDLAGGLGGAEPSLFSLQLGDGLPALPPRSACTEVERTEQGVRYRCEADGLAIEETWKVGEPASRLEVTLSNSTGRALEGTVALVMPARVDPEQQFGSSGGCASPFTELPMPTQAICRHADDVTRRIYDAEELVIRPEGRASYAGIDERYFLAVAVPLGGDPRCVIGTPTAQALEAKLVQPVSVPAGGTATLRYALVLGQKEADRLDELSSAIAAEAGIQDPELSTALDLGMWAAISRFLLVLLKIFHALIPNWGVAIILLTLTVKLLTFPLAWKSMKSMEEMRKLAPEIEALKKKHGEDREKLNLEMLQLYQKHKVNPLGGCLPMLIQMPIWIALYTTLQTSVELYNEPFIGGWLNDLTAKDPYYVLPLAMGATMFITQKMQPATSMDPMQQKMMLYFMPALFTAFMLQLPSGLTLYIFTNNILSIAQQLGLRKSMGMPLVGAPTGPASTAVVETKADRKKGKKGRER